MVAQLTIGFVGTPVDGHGLEPGNIAQSISFTAGATPATQAGTIGGVQVGRDGIAPGAIGTHDGTGDNAVTYSSLSGLPINLIDGFSITWSGTTYALDASAFVGVTTIGGLATVISTVDGPGGAVASVDFNGHLQITTPFLTTITQIALTTSTGLAETHTTVDITGITDAEAGEVDTFTLTYDGTPLDTSSIDFGAISNRAELAAALDALPLISVTGSAADGGTITITAETHGPRGFTGISLADLTPNPAVAMFGAATLAELDARVAAAESFELKLNGSELDLSSLDFGVIDTAAQLAAALEAVAGISAQLSGTAITITSDGLGAGNAFSELELIDNEGSPPAHATVVITGIDPHAGPGAAFTLSIDGVPVDTSAADLNAATDGASLAAELDKITGIDVVYGTGNGGMLTITASVIGPAVFSNISLTRPNMIVGSEDNDVLGANALGTWLVGLGGNDFLAGGSEDDRIDGGEGDDYLHGAEGADELDGGNGNDMLVGGAGDVLAGGAGDDAFVIDGLPASIAGGTGEDTLKLLVGMAVPDLPDVEKVEVSGNGITVDFSAASGPVAVKVTTPLGAFVVGSAHGDAVLGGDGNDSLDGAGGDDTLTGGAADDDLTGGGGTDSAVFSGTRAQYRVEQLGNGDIHVIDLRGGTPDGTDTVRQVERFVFADGTFLAPAVLNDPSTGGVSISGSVTEDQTLSADTAALADQDGLGPLHYQWRRNDGGGFVNVGADLPTYTLGDADVGAMFRLVVSYTDLNGTLEQVTSAAVGAVTNVNDAPVITSDGGSSSASLSLPENITAVTTVTASDIDGPVLSYAIVGGADAARFHLDATTGALTFVAAPDFEIPADADHDNIYVVDVRASDGSLFDDQSITITVTNTDDGRFGTSGDDQFTARLGHERIDAGGGNDTVTFNFRLVDATVTYAGNQVIVDSASSHTVLTGFETFVFTDGTVSNNDGDWLVDDLFYYARYRDVWNAHVDAEAHYHNVGWHEGRDPSAFFATRFYQWSSPDAAGADPLAHFHQSGWQQGRVTSLAFDTEQYLAANPDVAAAHIDPLWHFLAIGAGEGRRPVAPNTLIAANGFDYVHYLQNNPDVAAAGVDPFWHFQTIGWKEGRDPNALFDTAGYLAVYTDVAAANINPLDHYNFAGWREGRDPSVGFDTTAYLGTYIDVAAAGVNPLLHYLLFGQDEGRQSFGDGLWG